MKKTYHGVVEGIERQVTRKGYKATIVSSDMSLLIRGGLEEMPKLDEQVLVTVEVCPWQPCGHLDCAEFGPKECAGRGDDAA